MLDKYRTIHDEYENGEKKFKNNLNDLSLAVDEVQDHASNTLDDLNNIHIIISDIDKQFEEKTGITNLKDMAFLWGAVAIQCVRWILIPTLDIETLTPTTEDRKDSASEGKKDQTATGKQLDKMKDEREKQRFPDKRNIILLPVPYDAMKGTEDIVIEGVTPYGKQIYSKNHHSATLGHDPIIGQVIGTSNIMTRSITFHDEILTTRRVVIPSGRTQVVVNDPYSLKIMVEEVVESVQEDKERITAALIKENLHLQSDKYTKTGLPIPVLSAELQQKLLDKKWNSKELEDILSGAVKGIAYNYVVAMIINTIVGTLHGFCYNEKKDENEKLYSVRTRKVVATSNVIAEAINIGAVAGGSVSGVISGNPDLIKKSVSYLDIGGIIEAIHQVFKSKKLQENIRREFLEQELFAHFTDKKYSFLEESYYE
ncbi:MAG: hypothetical protein LUH19_00650 [Lachnospiraceae bacterium]|nr:hypothetical protein [Lachnospiraceae bacterium]